MKKTVSYDCILTTIYKALEDVNLLLPSEEQLKNIPDELLVGTNGRLDSLGVINLLVGVEQHLEQDYGVTFNLSANPDLFDVENRVLNTPSTFATYISSSLK